LRACDNGKAEMRAHFFCFPRVQTLVDSISISQ